MANRPKPSPWQPIIHHVGTHMHEPIEGEVLQRALDTMSWRLAPLPPYVLDQFVLTTCDEDKVVSVAIKPDGTEVAILMSLPDADERKRWLKLVVWQEQGSPVERDIAVVETANADKARVVYPVRSAYPAVIVCEAQVYWNQVVFDVGMYVDPSTVSNLTVWCNENKLSHVSFISDGYLYQLSRDNTLVGRVEKQHFGTPFDTQNTPTRYIWTGMVSGYPANISEEWDVDGVRQTIHYRDFHFQMPMWNEQIVRESIGYSVGGLQFVTEWRQKTTCVYWIPDPEFDRNDVKPREGRATGVLRYDHGGIYYLYERGERPIRQLLGFLKGEFIPCAPESTEIQAFGDHTRVLGFADSWALINMSSPKKPRRDRVQIVRGGVYKPDTSDDLGYGRFHNWLAIERRNTFRLMLPVAEPQSSAYKDYPLYGTPFHRLTEVKNLEGTKSVMTWDFTRGTFHILRYPHPLV